jgi:hypothetical protein
LVTSTLERNKQTKEAKEISPKNERRKKMKTVEKSFIICVYEAYSIYYTFDPMLR